MEVCDAEEAKNLNLGTVSKLEVEHERKGDK